MLWRERGALIRHEVSAYDAERAVRMLRAWKVTRTELERNIVDLLGYIESEGVTGARLYRLERLVAFLTTAEEQMRVYADDAGVQVADGRVWARQKAVEDFGAYMASIGGAFTALDPSVLESASARLRGENIVRLFRDMPSLTRTKLGDTLISGIGAAQHPRTIAGRMLKVADMVPYRAMNIARTELLTAYRDSAITQFSSSPVVSQWEWISAADSRTCPICWSKHGSLHPANEPFVTHPQCRCVPAPVSPSWESLGFGDVPEATRRATSGPALFERLSAKEQTHILGPGRFDAYKAGTPLSAMVTETTDDMWGDGLALVPIHAL